MVLVASFIALAVIIWRRAAAIRSGSLFVAPAAGEAVLALWQGRIDNYYYGFGLFFKTLAHYTYFYILVIIKSVAAIFRSSLTLVERKCAKLIDSTHSRGVIK